MASGNGGWEHEFQARKLAFPGPYNANQKAFCTPNNETCDPPADWHRCSFCAVGQQEYRTVMYRCRLHNQETPGWGGVIGVQQVHVQIKHDLQGQRDEKTVPCAWKGLQPSMSTAVGRPPLALDEAVAKATGTFPKTWSTTNDEVIRGPKHAVVNTTAAQLNHAPYSRGPGPGPYRPPSLDERKARWAAEREAENEERIRESKRRRNLKRSEQRRKYQESWDILEANAFYSKLGVKCITAPRASNFKISYLEHYDIMIPIRDAETQTPRSYDKWKNDMGKTELPTSKYPTGRLVTLSADQFVLKPATIATIITKSLEEIGCSPPEGGYEHIATRLNEIIFQKLKIPQPDASKIAGEVHPDNQWNMGSMDAGGEDKEQYDSLEYYTEPELSLVPHSSFH